jgi:flagellar basal body rod protein FlgF
MSGRWIASALSVLAVSLFGCAAPSPPAPAVAVEPGIDPQLLAALLDVRGSAPDAALTARLVALEERVGELAARGAATPVDALAKRPDADAAVLALRDSLVALETDRALRLQNIANARVPGYRRRTLVPGTRDEVRIDTRPGTLEVTNRQLDLAVDGPGWIAVIAEDGQTLYTRAGSLQLDADGALVTESGRRLSPEIKLPDDVLDISIDSEGRVCGRTAGNPETATHFGQLSLVAVSAVGLEDRGRGLYAASPTRGVTIATSGPQVGHWKQGFLERANVELVTELVDLRLIDQQRAALRHALAAHGVFVP